MKSNWIKVRGIGKLIHPTSFLRKGDFNVV